MTYKLQRFSYWTRECHAGADKLEAAYAFLLKAKTPGAYAAALRLSQEAESEFGRAMLALDKQMRPSIYAEEPHAETYEAPKLGSIWRHKDGEEYRVYDFTNTKTPGRPKYPPRVSYEALNDGAHFSGDLSDFEPRMTFVRDGTHCGFAPVPDPLVPGWYLAEPKPLPMKDGAEIVKVVEDDDCLLVQLVRDDEQYDPCDFTFLARIEAPELQP